MPEGGGAGLKKAIVTGATGFIGKALCEELLNCDYEVTAIVRPGSTQIYKLGNMLQTGRFNIIETELDGIEDADNIPTEADVFYHLAWNGSAGSDREDFNMQYCNIAYTAKAVSVAARCGCRAFVGAGSQAEYGVVHGTANEDTTAPNPFMMYGAAKLASYHMGRLVATQKGIRFIWPRIYSVYGVGENDGTLMSYLVKSLINGQVPELSPCTNMWNFMYITDCVRALRMLGEYPDACGIYNVASGDTRLLKDYVNEACSILAPQISPRFGAKQSNPDRTFWLEPDVDRLRQTGFECEVSFEEGIRKNQSFQS